MTALSHIVGVSSLRVLNVGFFVRLFQTQIQEIVSQAVYKDKKILELNQKILDNEKIVLDLQEHISEKAQVIAGRDKAVQVSNAQRSSSSLLP